MKRTSSLLKQAELAVGLIVCSWHTFAAPGRLADIPLMLGTQVQPNILLLVDDSGSMDWEVLPSNGASTVHGNPGFVQDYLSFQPTNETETLELCAGYNVMAYDPGRKYSIWQGTDSRGELYTNKTLTTALNEPYEGGAEVDLSNHIYVEWQDNDNDGVYDWGECAFRIDALCTTCRSVSDLSPEEQMNYANWYTYHRKREFLVKWVLSDIIQSSNDRIGLATLNNNGGVGTIINSVDNQSQPLNLQADQHKKTLMQNLFRIHSEGGTPLRQALKNAGDYFESQVTPTNSFLGFSPSPISPILSQSEGGECQQNFTLLLSDGAWNGASPTVGNTDAGTANPFDGGSFADTHSDTLADIAMHYYKRDLAPGLDNKVGIIEGLDENEAQHMVTYAIAFGVNGALKENPADFQTPFAWPVPVANTATTIDDMRHAAWNGRGAFLSASDPDSLTLSLTNAIQGIGNREGAASPAAFSSTSLRNGSLAFQARFNSSGWKGTLQAFDLSGKGAGNQVWDAAKILSSRDLNQRPRQIFTYNGQQGVPFKFPSNYKNLSPADINQQQLNDLMALAPYSLNQTLTSSQEQINQQFGEVMVNYLRVDASNEGVGKGKFRRRQGERLGAIIHSSPLYIQSPDSAYPDDIEPDEPYSEYIKQQAGRTPMVYVGANDGMLHGFNATTGDEVFAYVPGFLFSDQHRSGLHYLAERDYTHKPYVDGSPQAADVFLNNRWATYLVGGVRGGGKGIYALDITTPSLLSEANAKTRVKWEFTHPNLGYTFSRPVIGKMNNGRWAAIVGNGYNAGPGSDGKAKLFIIYLDGNGYVEIDTGVGSVANNDCHDSLSDCNGLSSPKAIDLTGDGMIDRVYVGDLHGHLWAIDLNGTKSSEWGIAYNKLGVPQPLFSACLSVNDQGRCEESNRQPITTIPEVVAHPERRQALTEPNLLIYFGTGQFIATQDPYDSRQQSQYGIWDAGQGGLTRANLQVQTISLSSQEPRGRLLSSHSVSYSTTGQQAEWGWMIDLQDTGERIVTKPTAIGDLLFFHTLVPEVDACSGNGYGYIMFVDRLTGGQPNFVVLDINNNGSFDDLNISGYRFESTPGGSQVIDDYLVTSDSMGELTSLGIQVTPRRQSRRASWSFIK